MELTDRYTLPVDRQTVWNALNDPVVLKSCIAGCESFDRVSDTEFACAVTASVGPVKARFKAKVTLLEIDAPNTYTLNFDGQGGPAGFGRGTARVTLTDTADGGTTLAYTANAQVGGKLAQVGSRLIDAAAKKMAGDFFGKFAEKLGGEKIPLIVTTAPVHSAPAGLGQPDTHFPLWLKVIGAVGAVTVLYILTRH